jgi:hypothetical protein
MDDKYAVESRVCGQCKFLSKHWDGACTCRKNLMYVIISMHVTYEKEKGTCFESVITED